jgi:hypothetical protein
MWARFVAQQNLATVLRCHITAFDVLGRMPKQILYDRMRTAIFCEVDHLPVVAGGGDLFLQPGNTRYEGGAIILTLNRGRAEWS